MTTRMLVLGIGSSDVVPRVNRCVQTSLQSCGFVRGGQVRTINSLCNCRHFSVFLWFQLLDSITAYSYVAWVFDFLSKKNKKKLKKRRRNRTYTLLFCQPIPRPDPVNNKEENLDQVLKSRLDEKELKNDRGPTIEELSKMFYTTKHRWYPVGQ